MAINAGMSKTYTNSLTRDNIALGLALLAFCLHAAFAGRYDVFRDELYFIVCGRHPAFGYVDQPPLVPLLSAGFYALGHTVWLLRLPAILAAAALVWLAARFARLLGGGAFAAVMAGLAVTIAPMLMGMATVFSTTAFDPLAWTLIAYLLVRAVQDEDPKALIWCGVVAGLDFEAKYALAFWAVSLLTGLVLTPQRRIFREKALWLGAALATLIGLPSLIWQAAHGWPFLELAAAARDKNTATPPLAFLLNQLLIMNPLLAPLWIAGIVAPSSTWCASWRTPRSPSGPRRARRLCCTRAASSAASHCEAPRSTSSRTSATSGSTPGRGVVVSLRSARPSMSTPFTVRT